MRRDIMYHEGNVSGTSQLVGFSAKINDPSFDKYAKGAKRSSLIFSLILAVAAVIGFPVYGSITGEMQLPYSLLYGIGIGALFIVIAVAQNISQNLDVTWDGTIKNKISGQKRFYDRNTKRYRTFMEYKLIVEKTNGKLYTDVLRDSPISPVIYDYFNIGDRVRHHKGFYCYEKYDKSRDDSILCIACLDMNDIKEDWCARCKCALLK
jgi:hypothetical protein